LSSPETLGAYREMLLPAEKQSGWRTIRRGAVGLAIFGIAGWLWRQNSKAPELGKTAADETTDQRGT
jgi:hypothetical protein